MSGPVNFRWRIFCFSSFDMKLQFLDLKIQRYKKLYLVLNITGKNGCGVIALETGSSGRNGQRILKYGKCREKFQLSAEKHQMQKKVLNTGKK